LQDRCNSEQVVGHVEVPVGLELVDGGEARSLAVTAHVFVFVGNAKCRQVQAADAARRGMWDVPRHAVVAEIGERVAERGQLPIEHGDHARLGRMEHQVVEAEVAMDDRYLAFVARRRGNVGWQPLDQPFHCRDGLRHRPRAVGRSLVLLAPPADLAVEIVAGFAVAGQAAVSELHGMQRRDDAVHLFIDIAAAGGRHFGQGLVP
jgi:hypothetical protein